MDAANPLFVFAALVLGIVVLPGMDMAFVLASALRGGVRSGAAAVAGVVLGGLVHVMVGVAGIALVLALAPAAFNALLLAGALYLAWIGVALLRHGAGTMGAARAEAKPGATLLRAAATNLLNPKAYVFMLAVFPQFLRPERGGVALQAATLAAIIALTQIIVYGAVAVVASGAARRLRAQPRRQVLLGRAVGVMLLAMSTLTVAGAWRGSPAAAMSVPVSESSQPAPVPAQAEIVNSNAESSLGGD